MLGTRKEDILYKDSVAKAMEMCIEDQRLDHAMKVLEQEAKSNRLPLEMAAMMKEYVTNGIPRLHRHGNCP
ncbi:hypothetical protein MAM1_0311c09538 [Mucor ambiguus]|uniref:Uncharacterized protein n=1 Tax=Mucor ambiguus TaxID=91626 RepID=A0A0C9MR99_9FUNG|nr:hypothetical protein MAM1_0311c09538 [Mucor ambiguus]